MSICPQTGLSVPECSCARCIERQLEEFAPGRPVACAGLHDPLVLHEVRPQAPLPPPVSERLSRPAL